jgi:enoyl-[acyl-carrier protein] reductase II
MCLLFLPLSLLSTNYYGHMTPFKNRVTQLFQIDYPIIQAGMIWASGWRLASAVSNAGGLGIIGAGSMYPDVLREHIQKCKAATDRYYMRILISILRY